MACYDCVKPLRWPVIIVLSPYNGLLLLCYDPTMACYYCVITLRWPVIIVLSPYDGLLLLCYAPGQLFRQLGRRRWSMSMQLSTALPIPWATDTIACPEGMNRQNIVSDA